MKPTFYPPGPRFDWNNRARPYDGPPATTIWFPNAASEHPHWKLERVPGRKVLRQQARRRGEFRPRRHYKSKRRTGPVGRIFNSGTMPLIPSFVQNFPSFIPKGGDR